MSAVNQNGQSRAREQAAYDAASAKPLTDVRSSLDKELATAAATRNLTGYKRHIFLCVDQAEAKCSYPFRR